MDIVARLHEEAEQCDPAATRRTAPGYIGGDLVARGATDEQICWIVARKNVAAALENQAKDFRRDAQRIEDAVRAEMQDIRAGRQ